MVRPIFVTITTDNAAHDGIIDFSTTIDGVTEGTPIDDNLVILAGDSAGTQGGSLLLGGIIGGGVHLDSLKINATDGDLGFNVPQIGDGTNAGVSGVTQIGNSLTTNDIVCR